MTEQVSLIEYPTDFPIKVMGLTQPGFAQAVVSIVRQHAPDYDAATIELRKNRTMRRILPIARDERPSVYRRLFEETFPQMLAQSWESRRDEDAE